MPIVTKMITLNPRKVVQDHWCDSNVDEDCDIDGVIHEIALTTSDTNKQFTTNVILWW